MKHWTLRILLGLILGAATTVAVAWWTTRMSNRAITLNQRETVIAGWPAGAMQCEWLTERRDGSLITTCAFGFVITQQEHYRYALPLRPILPGFFIDTFFYGGIWLGLFFGVGTVRRGVRRRRGRCPQCGYDLRGQKSEVRE